MVWTTHSLVWKLNKIAGNADASVMTAITYLGRVSQLFYKYFFQFMHACIFQLEEAATKLS